MNSNRSSSNQAHKIIFEENKQLKVDIIHKDQQINLLHKQIEELQNQLKSTYEISNEMNLHLSQCHSENLAYQ